jgi:hypothetical protein
MPSVTWCCCVCFCSRIFGKLDKNQDGLIDLREWVSVLFDLFRFMSAAAFLGKSTVGRKFPRDCFACTVSTAVAIFPFLT